MDLQGVFTGHFFFFVNVASCDGNWKGKTENLEKQESQEAATQDWHADHKKHQSREGHSAESSGSNSGSEFQLY